MADVPGAGAAVTGAMECPSLACTAHEHARTEEARYAALTELLKSLSPAAVDAEIRLLAADVTTEVELVSAMLRYFAHAVSGLGGAGTSWSRRADVRRQTVSRVAAVDGTQL